jgi:hypothetical protein
VGECWLVEIVGTIGDVDEEEEEEEDNESCLVNRVLSSDKG